MYKKTFNRILITYLCCLLCFILAITVIPSSVIFADETENEENEETEDNTDNESESAEESSEISENTDSNDDSEDVSENYDDDYQSQIKDLQSRQKELYQQQTELGNKIQSVKDSKKKQQLLANSIDEQIYLIKEQISVCEEKIGIMKKRIAQKESGISAKEADIDESLQLFRDRVKAIYMTGGYSDTANSLIMLLTSKSVSEFLTRSEFLQRIAEHDSELVSNLKDELSKLEDEKAAVIKDKEKLEEEKKGLADSQKELDAQLLNAQNSIQDLSALQKEYEENYEEIAELNKQVQQEIADIYKNLKTSSADYVGGEMMWPVPGYSTISCYYGWRFNHTDFHTGNDITGSGIHGAKVVAANTGTVIFTKYCPYNGKSYGYGTYIIVDHGGSITTLYAHLSNITVEVGDIVAMGEQIGNVGNTGWSTGAHLHFEVRINGSSVDSLSYIT